MSSLFFIAFFIIVTNTNTKKNKNTNGIIANIGKVWSATSPNIDTIVPNIGMKKKKKNIITNIGNIAF